MQRIEALIEKLRTQFFNKADLSQLMATTQMIQREINGEMKQTAVLGTSGVAVFVPNAMHIEKQTMPEEITNNSKVFFELAYPTITSPEEEEELLLDLQKSEADMLNYVNQQKNNSNNNYKEHFVENESDFDPINDVPTLSQQIQNRNPKRKIKNNTIAPENHTNRVADINTAISPEDRNRFINNLFRGDEAMYERSMKTINNFGTLAHAEHWIKRELKIMLGWNNTRDVTQFDQIVQRRFL